MINVLGDAFCDDCGEPLPAEAVSSKTRRRALAGQPIDEVFCDDCRTAREPSVDVVDRG